MELLVVIVLIAILAAIALSRPDPKPATYLAVMQADLRNVITAQEAHFADNAEYANSAAQLEFDPSPDVDLVVHGAVSGWSARTQHKVRPDFRCAIYLGTINPIIAPATEEGIIECEPKKGGGNGKKKKGK